MIDRGSKKGLSIFINQIDTNAAHRLLSQILPDRSNFVADVNHFVARSSKMVKKRRKENDHED